MKKVVDAGGKLRHSSSMERPQDARVRLTAEADEYAQSMVDGVLVSSKAHAIRILVAEAVSARKKKAPRKTT